MCGSPRHHPYAHYSLSVASPALPQDPSEGPTQRQYFPSDIFKPTKFGKKFTVTLIPGDGTRAGVTESEQMGVTGSLKESVLSLRRNKVGLKGSGHQSFNVTLRRELDIYVSLRISEFAFQFANVNGRNKFISIYKANIMKFDVILNLYRSTLFNIGAALEYIVFDPGCRYVGLAYPTVLLLSGTIMLRHLGLTSQPQGEISQAVYNVIREGKVRAKDIGGNNTTTDFTNAILEMMEVI
ncbi:hypothetical protein BDZ91DRAFT_776282 [Kalaharituber pfeilii]|nr:hypothetical protein BDZ91DRAFT_776282 [Kalaharituber pfeilii]